MKERTGRSVGGGIGEGSGADDGDGLPLDRWTIREVYDGSIFADGEPRVLETDLLLFDRASWEASPQKDGGEFHLLSSSVGFVLARRVSGL